MEDDLNIFFKWKTTSIFFENGRRPQSFKNESWQMKFKVKQYFFDWRWLWYFVLIWICFRCFNFLRLFSKILRSSSIIKNIEVVFHLKKCWGRLPSSKILRSSSIFYNIEAVLHFQKIWGSLQFFILLPTSNTQIIFRFRIHIVRNLFLSPNTPSNLFKYHHLLSKYY